MIDISQLLPLMQCPDCRCGTQLSFAGATEIKCANCGACHPIVNGCPVLLSRDNAIFRRHDYGSAKSTVNRCATRGAAGLIPSPSVNLAGKRVLALARDLIAPLQEATVLVVGGGGQRRWLDAQLVSGTAAIRIVYSDIDVNADVDIFCDGHDLPFINGAFDAVVTTAVLEHVLYPERVATEISRVLKVGGVLYSELPFMQQVHEGAYDFTRYTLSGHRRLFNTFSELDAGMIAGPGTALVWALENFALAFVRRNSLRVITKAMVRLAFFWLKYFDRLLKNRPEAMDGASCTYFLGRKIEGRIPDIDIIARYVGAKHLRHV